MSIYTNMHVLTVTEKRGNGFERERGGVYRTDWRKERKGEMTYLISKIKETMNEYNIIIKFKRQWFDCIKHPMKHCFIKLFFSISFSIKHHNFCPSLIGLY